MYIENRKRKGGRKEIERKIQSHSILRCPQSERVNQSILYPQIIYIVLKIFIMIFFQPLVLGN